MKNKLVLALVAIGCFAVGIVLYLNFFPRQPLHERAAAPAPTKPASVIGSRRPDIKLLDTHDRPHELAAHDGKVIVVNFWATWCPPCVREIPALIELQDKYRKQGVQLLGVALDNKQAVIDFIDPMGVNYPVLIAEQEGIALTQAYGNHLGGLPYTVIIDREGTIRHAMMKEITLPEAQDLLQPLL